MAKKIEKIPTKLYWKTSLILFAFFLMTLILTVLIIGIFSLTPLRFLIIDSIAITTIITFLSIFLSSAIISCLACYFVMRRFLRPIVELSDKSMKVAKGDFSVSIEEKSRIPEVKKCLESFNIMVRELNKVEMLSNDFVSNVSHEFKTPLSVIRSNINILENSSLTKKEREQCIGYINNSIDKLSTLISNVLKISKLDNKGIKLTNKPYRLDEQLRQSVLSFTNEIEKKNISFDISLEECVINSDENLLDQVWINLIGNAIKFSRQDGLIKINLIVDQKIIVTIEDNGIGMNEETKAHIFDRFYQGETSHNSQGNGLGLTIVYKILKMCNAKIFVESEENKYTKFQVEFEKSIKV